MILRFAFFTLTALGLLGFGIVAWIATRPPPPDPATLAAMNRITVLVAARPVRAGNLLKPEDLASKEVTLRDAGRDSTADTQDARHALAGALVRRSLSIGDVVHAQDVMRPGDPGFLAAVLGLVDVPVELPELPPALGLLGSGLLLGVVDVGAGGPLAVVSTDALLGLSAAR